MTFDDILAGLAIFVDANPLIYHFSAHPRYGVACTRLVERIEHREVQAFTSAHVLADVAHRLMILEAMHLLGWPATSLAARLRQHHTEIPRLTLYQQALVKLGQQVKQLVMDRGDLRQAFDSCAAEVRQVTFSLARIEDQLERNAHEIHAVGIALVFTNSLGMKFAFVPHGTFWMGGGGGKPGDQQAEIAHDFYSGVYPVTQDQWQAIMGNNPSYFSRSGDGKDKVKNIAAADLKQFPVEQVSWEDAQQFIEKLNAREKKDSEWMYHLPTEAEWEYICRGGATSKEDCSFDFYFDQPTNDLSSSQANFAGNYPAGNAPKGRYLERPAKVGSYKPNRLGICDMHGNVWDGCEDSYDGGADRVIRGGSWSNHASDCRAAFRGRSPPAFRLDLLGFRLARVPSGQ